MVGFSFAPQGWALCNGQTLPISANNALFALLGTTYGGNGTTTFNLPDLQGRLPLHAGNGAGLPVYALGQKAGTQSVTLTQQHLPSHTHVATFTPSGGGGTPTLQVHVHGIYARTNSPTGISRAPPAFPGTHRRSTCRGVRRRLGWAQLLASRRPSPVSPAVVEPSPMR